jgi:hypothetical protein
VLFILYIINHPSNLGNCYLYQKLELEIGDLHDAIFKFRKLLLMSEIEIGDCMMLSSRIGTVGIGIVLYINLIFFITLKNVYQAFVPFGLIFFLVL